MVTLDDRAPTAIESAPAGSPLTGTFRPETPARLLSFNGIPLAGTWTLTVTDDTAGFPTTLNSWAIRFQF